MNDEAGQLLKMQKVDETRNEESKQQEVIVQEKKCHQKMKTCEVDFVKESRHTSFKSCNSGDALMIDDQNILKGATQKLTPMNPIKDISHNLQKQSMASTRGKVIFNSGIRQKNESPIIMPNVIRPTQGHQVKQGTPQSVLSRASHASPYNNQ